jgi:hypothetical protein
MNLGRSQLVTTAPEAPQRAEVGAGEVPEQFESKMIGKF